MATLVFSAIGTLIGGPLGGAIGALVGQQVDNSVISSIGGGSISGARLSDLTVTTSSYGAALPRHFGAMRVAGSVIWATDLAEHTQSQGGGKGKPSVTTYSYTSSFAVALGSRPLSSVGRIWADGTLLRGAAGDLKVGGAMRFYPGDDNQAPDVLIASAEGATLCPGFRGVPYVVLENLDLTNYGNRIPAMSFEVFADSGALSLAPLFGELLGDVDAAVPLGGISGFSCEGSFKETLAKFQPMFPMNCDASGTSLTIAPELQQAVPIVLGEAAVAVGQGDFGTRTGFARKRAPLATNPPRVLRYYDTDRDYQPGTQRAIGQPSPGQPQTIELPAAMNAASAFGLVSHTANAANWARETLAWRSTELDPAVVPGATVIVSETPGLWRVTVWEWRASGVELTLERIAPPGAGAGMAGDAGRANLASDVGGAATSLIAFELPLDGTTSLDTAAIYAAVSSAGAGWSGASIYVDQGTGALVPLGASGRKRSIIGTVAVPLGAASPLLFDRNSALTVQLAGADMALAEATTTQLAAGGNRALIGSEIIQFTTATALGGGAWRVAGLLRGRGGTENAIAGHVAGEGFALLNGGPTALSADLVGGNPGARIAALGLADAGAVEAPIINRGITLRPLSPVHPSVHHAADGSLTLAWVRRARGAWQWLGGVDVPLQEEAENYRVSYGALTAPVMVWSVSQPSLTIDTATMASLSGTSPGGSFQVQQSGTYALSDALLLI